MRLLLKYGADPDVTNEDKERPEDITKSRTIEDILRTAPPDVIHVDSREKIKPPLVTWCTFFVVM